MASSGGLTSFSFNSNTLSVIAGDTGSLTLTLDSHDDFSAEVINRTTITFTSSNTSTATVAPGTTIIEYATHSYPITITGVSAGSATITATCTDSQGTAWTSTATITVTNATQVIVAEQSLQDIADAIRGKLGVATTYKPADMASAIASISSGSSTTITPLSVTENGTYTAPTGTAYSPVTVNVSGSESVGIPREVSSGGIYQMPANNFTFSLPANATSIGPYALYYAFYGCTSLTSVDLSYLTTLTGSNGLSNAFRSCAGLTSVDLSSLTTVPGSYALYYAFSNCTGLTSVDLSSLTTVPGSYALANAFYNCTSLTSVDLSSLTTLTGSNALAYAFNTCTGLTSVDLSSLTTVPGPSALYYAFSSCTSLTSLSFPALTTSSFGSTTNQFNNMLTGVGGCTVHFPAAIQEKIETMTGYPNFGGTNTTVLFDL